MRIYLSDWERAKVCVVYVRSMCIITTSTIIVLFLWYTIIMLDIKNVVNKQHTHIIDNSICLLLY